ncbi:phosphatidate cytidylyltransferase [Lentilactobacillus senioris]|uniref:phosphatidate cytidylyltransferase n=1 Tax=Lentilactobacillus senioris TaxID=931534 RepID=UPI0006D1C6F3|nr:phosphatidate cytidylyltransferase [Lentilactobacillus senioris]
MKQRVITAVVALIIFIPIILAGGIWIDIAAAVLGIVAISEILVMKKKLLISPEAIISYIGGVLSIIAPESWINILPAHASQFFLFYILVMLLLLYTVFSKNRFSFDDAGVLTLGMLYIGIGFHYFLTARHVGLTMLLYALFIVWTTDSGAYIFGRMFGKHKLAPPHVSPNKTWEGSIYGSLFGTIICSIWAWFFPIPGFSGILMVLVTLCLSIVGQFGDLVESSLKRYYGVKDSGKILPGHGGILDRFDSLLFVLPTLHLLGII